MSQVEIYKLIDIISFNKAGPNDLVEMKALPGQHPLIIPKWILEILIYSIVYGEVLHVSGATGTGKSSIIESLTVPDNFYALLDAFEFPRKPLRLHQVEMALFDTPTEIYFRRSLVNGMTFDEDSPIVKALKEASETEDQFYHVIWLKEIGRCHNATIQGALLNLIKRGEIYLRDSSMNINSLCWIADSNYAVMEDWVHTLITLDDALKRRFSINIKIEFLSETEEVIVLNRIVQEDILLKEKELEQQIKQVVKLGNLVRRSKLQGKLTSISAPTIYGYLAFLRLHTFLQRSPLEAAKSTFLGNASAEDEKELMAAIGETEGFGAISGKTKKGGIADGNVI
ncbi:AAA family ATPase [Candidatus Poribacteria bacterium]|nr:AAA family ATPase [Candidatus Poribacteria bacterium]